jgi:hypothetical protein
MIQPWFASCSQGKLKEVIGMNEKERIEELETILNLLLDNIDYIGGACQIVQMIGAVLPTVILKQARKALGKE